jgi:uncharacterized membrane protein YciS (DUF1049 family)
MTDAFYNIGFVIGFTVTLAIIGFIHIKIGKWLSRANESIQQANGIAEEAKKSSQILTGILT